MMGLVSPTVHAVTTGFDDTPLASWQNKDVSYDYAIGGLPFLSAASKTYVLQRKTAPYTKNQIDQTVSPGEQTLVNWWLRSQQSFHAGTGITYEEPSNQVSDTIPYRFQDSAGVDVWTAGKVSLLPKADEISGLTANNLQFATDGIGNLWVAADDEVSFITTSGGGATGAVTGNPGHDVLAMCFGGDRCFVVTDTALYSVDYGATSYITLYTYSSISKATIGWVKSRLIAGLDDQIYELTTAGGALPTPLYDGQGLVDFVSVSESPQAIYVAGNRRFGDQGAIWMFVLDTSGLLPTLTGAITAAELPVGESISCIYGYLGSFLAIGTNRGVRVADIQIDGSLQYGPFTVKTNGVGSEVRAITGVGRFLYGGLEAVPFGGLFDLGGGINGKSGLWRIDLGTAVGLKQFAWATDRQAHELGVVSSVGYDSVGDRVIFAVQGSGIYSDSATGAFESSGYLKTGDIRFHMLEPKLFKYVQVFTEPLINGTVQITAQSETGEELLLGQHFGSAVSLGESTGTPIGKDLFPNQYGPRHFVSLTFVLSGDTLFTPVLTGYQLTGLPAQKRQRQIILPLACYDHESDSKDVGVGYEGRALERLRALETLEERGDVIQFDDLTVGGGPARQVLIDGLQFIQDVSPSTDQGGSGWGGTILATLRTVD